MCPRGAIAVGLLLSAAAWAASLEPPPFGLDDNVAPHRYAIELTVDPNRDSMQGNERIEVALRKATQVIWLNAVNLDVSDAVVETTKRRLPARVTPVGGDFLALEVESRIPAGEATVTLRFTAPLADHAIIGPYRLKFEDNWYVFTTFTPTGARSAFPCFDQPRFKTSWELTLRVPSGLQAVANSKAAAETMEAGGTKLVRFVPTPPLASEVVAFAVGPLDMLKGPESGSGHTPVRVVTPRGHSGEGEEAAAATEDIMARLEDYTGIPYPYDKLDQVALPMAPFGAIENPGLITYRMRSLLMSSDRATTAQERALRSVEAHEMAHQWFGNLVTQATWNDVWLSEGFATWLSAKVMDEGQPAMRRHLRAAIARERIMTADEGPKTRPVRAPMNSREDLENVYSQFVYQKGAAVLEMLEGWLGPDVFQAGLRRYLNDHRFDVATTGELAAALRVEARKDPTDVMHDFLDQTGVPVVRAEVHCEPGTQPRIIFEQTNSSHDWKVPVCWRADGRDSCVVVETRRQVELPSGAACPAWIYPNANGSGYYRTRLDARQITAVVDEALWQLTAAERLTLAHDLGALLHDGATDRATVLVALRRLAGDREPEVAAAAKSILEGRAEQPRPN